MSNRPRTALFLALAAATGCFGQVGGAADQPANDMPAPGPAPAGPPTAGGDRGPAPGGPVAIPASPFHRLTRAEYVNAIGDLLGAGAPGAGASSLPDDGKGASGFLTAGNVETIDLQRYLELAESIAIKDVPRLLGCDPAVGDELKCVEGWITAFGRRAFRRPLAPDEVATLRSMYTSVRDQLDRQAAVEAVVRYVLVAPDFLYLVEGAPPRKDTGGVLALTPYEVAARLALFLWSSLPDDALLAAADRNELAAPEQIEAQARRMLGQTARAGRTVGRFHREWLELFSYAGAAAVSDAAVVGETSRFTGFVVLEGDGMLRSLLAAPYTFASSALGKFYGVVSAGTDAMPSRIDLPPQRAGLLMQASFLGAHSSPSSSPVRRGVVLLRRLLCQEPPAPPPDVPPPPSPSATTTTRERLEQHRTDPACGGCHAVIDPPGLPFETFDMAGAYRASESGKPIDARATIAGTLDLDGSYDGAVPFVQRLASSRQVNDCVARQWFRMALGRPDDAGDASDVRLLSQRLAQSGGNVKELMVAVTLTDAFRTRRVRPATIDPKGARP